MPGLSLPSGGVSAAALGRLGVIPLPQHGFICGIGDSKIDRNNMIVGVDQTISAQGQLAWASVLCDQRLRFDVSLNYGVSGQKLAEINARIDAALADAKAKGAIAALLNGGTNDLAPPSGSPTSLADMQAQALISIGKVLAMGMVALYLTLGPRGAWASLTAGEITIARQKRHAFNRWLKRLPIAGLVVVDANPYLTDPAANDDPIGGIAGAQTAQTVDGLHEGVGAAFWEGFAIALAINRIMPHDPVREVGALNLQSADNPFGNLFPNPHFLGTGGTLSGATGVAPTGWAVERLQGNGSCVASIVQRQVGPTTLNMLQLAISAGTVATEYFVKASAVIAKAGRWNTGDKLVCDWPTEVDASSQAILYLATRLAERSAAPATIQGKYGLLNQLVSGAYQFYPDQAWSGVMTTPIMVSDANAVDAAQPRAQIYVAANKSATVRFWLPSFRKLAAA